MESCWLIESILGMIVLLLHKHSYIMAEVNNTLIVATTTNIYSLDVTYTDNIKKWKLNLQNVVRAVAVAFDPVEEKIYWSDVRADCVSRAFLNGSEQEVIISEHVTNTDGLTIDIIGRLLYWTDTDKDEIEVMTLDGKYRKTLVKGDLYEPRAIELDTEEGYMFWTDWGLGFHKIERGYLDGTSRVKIVSVNIAWPNGLVVDTWNKKVYWADAKTDQIEVVDYNGDGRRIITNKHIVAPFSMTQSLEQLYWTDWREDVVYSIPKSSLSGDKTTLFSDFDDIMGLTFLNRTLPIAIKNNCAINKGGCSHFCFNLPQTHGYLCGCPSVFQLKDDGKTCDIPTILYLQDGQLKSTEVLNGSDIITHQPAMTNTLSFDMYGGSIFWTEESRGVVRGAKMDSSKVTNIIWSGLRSPVGIAVDWVNKNLFWADMRRNRIEMSLFSGKYRKVLIWMDIDSPHIIKLDPYHGYMYWSTWGSNVQIHKAAMDGTLHQVIVPESGRIDDLVVDVAKDFIYWIDFDEKVIFRADKEGKRQARLVSLGLQRPTELLLFGMHIMWYDRAAGTLELTDTMFGAESLVLRRNLTDLSHITLWRTSNNENITDCALANCSQICLPQVHETTAFGFPNENAVTCYCETHFTLDDDEKSCKAPSNYLLITTGTNIYRLIPDSHDSPDVPLHIGDDFVKKLSCTKSPKTGNMYILTPDMVMIMAEDNSVVSMIRLSFENNEASNILYSQSLGTAIFASWKANTIFRVEEDEVTAMIYPRQLLNEGPRHLATHNSLNITIVSTDKGSIFACDNTKEPCVQIIATNSAMGVLAVALDAEEDVLYWVNGENQTIERTLLNGEFRTTLVSHLNIRETQLAVYDQQLYWLSEKGRKLNRATKFDSFDKDIFLHFDSKIESITSFLTKHVTKPCPRKKGHFCLIDYYEDYHEFYCPKNYVNNTKGECMPINECNTEYFLCPSNLCITKSEVCDGVQHCPGGEDEAECCSSTDLKCPDSTCKGVYNLCSGTLVCSTSKSDRCCVGDSFLCKQNNKCYTFKEFCADPKICQDGPKDYSCVIPSADKRSQSSNNTAIISGVLVALLALVAAGIALYLKFRKIPSPRSRPLIQEEVDI